MSVWFITYKAGEKTEAKMFQTQEHLWEWIEEYKRSMGSMPHDLCVFAGKCIADLS